MKIIDSHVHVYPEFLQKEFDRLAQREPWFAPARLVEGSEWGTAEELVAAMDETGVESSLVTTFAFRDQGLCREMNGLCARRGAALPRQNPAARRRLARASRRARGGRSGPSTPERSASASCSPTGSPSRSRTRCGCAASARSARSAGKFVMFHTAEQAGPSVRWQGEIRRARGRGLLPQIPDDEGDLAL